MNAVSVQQITIIRTLASKAGMDEETYRALLEREAGVRSARQLTRIEAGRVIDHLRQSTGQSAWAKGAVAGLDSPVARKMQALWITGYNLGLIHDRSDKAMLSFLERQTGVSHTRFLTHPSEATGAIEALKSWLRREGGVEWPIERRRGEANILDIKGAIIKAQWTRIGEIGDVAGRFSAVTLISYASKVAGRRAWDEFESCHYDAVQKALGRRIRDAVTRRQRELRHAS